MAFPFKRIKTIIHLQDECIVYYKSELSRIEQRVNNL